MAWTDLFGGYILLIILIVIILIIILVWIIFSERRLVKVLRKGKAKEKNKFEREIYSLKSSDAPPEEKFASIDKFARDFLSKKYKIKKDTDYSQITDLFAKKKDRAIETFSKNMVEALYSGKEMDNEQIKSLLGEFQRIIKRSEFKAARIKLPRKVENKVKTIPGLPSLRNKVINVSAEKAKERKEAIAAEKKVAAEAEEKRRKAYNRRARIARANAMIDKLDLQKRLLNRAFRGGYLKEDVYKSSLHNIENMSTRLKEKYL